MAMFNSAAKHLQGPFGFLAVESVEWWHHGLAVNCLTIWFSDIAITLSLSLSDKALSYELFSLNFLTKNFTNWRAQCMNFVFDQLLPAEKQYNMITKLI